MTWMRQDEENPTPRHYSPDPPVEAVRTGQSAGTQPVAHIGKTVFIKGEIRSEEDLVIDGKVEGKVDIKKNRLTVGATGKIDADVRARWVVVSGQVNGSITAGDRLELTASGRVNGDVQCPRLIIAEGARLQGAVDTDPIKGANPAGKEQQADRQQAKAPGQPHAQSLKAVAHQAGK